MSNWIDDYKQEFKEKSYWEMTKEGLNIFRKDRPLTKTEKHWHLPVDKMHSVAELDDHQAILRLNSSFLEVINPKYGHKGIGLILAIPAIPAILFGLVLAVLGTLAIIEKGEYVFAILFIVGTVFIALLLLVLMWAAYQDVWPYTHYPIRFCRKTKMVYAMQRKKPTLSIPWEQLYFHMSVNGEVMPGTGEYRWMLRAYQLDENKCVKRSFFISPWVESNDEMKYRLLPYWEYIRRYMEEGPQSVPVPKFIIPAGEARESLSLCWQQLKFRYLEGSAFGYVFFGWFIGIASIVRWIALRIAPRPKWPEEIEAACKIEAGDPYHYKGSPDGVPIKITT